MPGPDIFSRYCFPVSAAPCSGRIASVATSDLWNDMSTGARLWRVAGLQFLLIALPLAASAQTSRPHILVSNDDGVGHEGLAAMVAELRTFADVVVVAPDRDHSGASHSSIIRTIRVEVTPHVVNGEVFGYGVNATPADAARFGIMMFGADRPFDLVVSGINQGANTGNIAHYSGTVGVAKEAALHGIPAIATSQDAQQDYALSARITAAVVRQVLTEGLPEGVLLSVNIPRGELRGVQAAPMGGTYFGIGRFEEIGEAGDARFFRAVTRGAVRGGDHTDTTAYLDGYVTITPLQLDWTDGATLERIQAWDLSIE
jgi:5'-nucleotidase